MKDTDNIDNKIDIFDVKLDVLTAKETMRRVIEYMGGETVNTVEIVAMETLMQGQDNPDWKRQMSRMNLVLPGDTEIFKAADVKNQNSIKDLDKGTFFRMFLKYLQKNKKSVFLIAGMDNELEKLEKIMKPYESGIDVTGTAILPEGSGMEANVINRMNGAEADCILSVLQYPQQASFIIENSELIDARLWMGCAPMLKIMNQSEQKGGRLRHFILKKVFRYRLETQRNRQTVPENKDL